MKECSRCGVEKDFNLFQKRKASKDGYTASCKKCLSEYDKSRANLPHRVKARSDYQKTENGKSKCYAAKKKWQLMNSKKRSVHVKTGNAIRDGVLSKGVCEVCGSTEVHAHHDDYDKPLRVRWLCSKHHTEWHSENGEGLNA